MNIAEAKRQVEAAVRAYLACDDAGQARIPADQQRPLFLVGAPGVGKSAIVGQAAADLGVAFVSYAMTHHTRQSAIGLPVIERKVFDGHTVDVSEYTMSEIVASVYEEQERTGLRQGILFLDEVNCVSETLYPAMLQFLQFKTFGRHRLPAGWVVVCAGNPPAYNRNVRPFDIATLDRLRTISVEPDYPAWKAFALARGVHPAVPAFLDANPDCFYAVESAPTGKRFVTARGWSDLSATLSLYEELGLDVDEALVGQFVQDGEIAARFWAFYRLFRSYRDVYAVPDILAGTPSPEARARAAAAGVDERLALAGMLAAGVDAAAGEAVECEAAVEDLRDAVRSALGAMAAGEPIEGALAGAKAKADERLGGVAGEGADARRARAGLRRVAGWLESFSACADEAALRRAYDEVRAGLRAKVAAAARAIDAAYAFVDGAFGAGEEALAFTAELTARPQVVAFVRDFGSDAYLSHAGDLAGDDRAARLAARVDALDLP